MEIHQNKKADITVLEPAGRLDTNTSRPFEDRINEILGEGESKFVIDCRELEYVSSAGLRVLLMLARKLQGKGGALVLCSLSDSVREVLDISGFSRIFTIEASQAEALKKINAGARPTAEVDSPGGDTEGLSPVASLAVSILEGKALPQTSNPSAADESPDTSAPPAPEAPPEPPAESVGSVSGGSGEGQSKGGFWNRLRGKS
ncbi:MAG: STAS domain-containing protein [Acidobacteriota bacterium]